MLKIVFMSATRRGGRQDVNQGKKKDFSCSDRKFAHNLNLKFFTPEEYFLNEDPAKFEWGGADLEVAAAEGEVRTEEEIASYTSKDQEMILLCGFPAAGKSTFANTYLVPKGYIRVNRDTLKTQEKCIKVAMEEVKNGKHVVIDNTNPDPNVRAAYIEIAQDHDIPVRCFWLQTNEDLAKHLNLFRERISDQKHVSRIGYNMFKKNFKEPNLDEGFSEIKHIRFVAAFQNDHERQVFQQMS